MTQSVIERFDSKSVANQRQRLLMSIPDGHRKHADTSFDRAGDAPLRESDDDRFGVRLASERSAALLQFASQFEVVINLAVIGKHESTARRRHRLMAML